MKATPLALAGLLVLSLGLSHVPADAGTTPASPTTSTSDRPRGDSEALARSARVDDPSRALAGRDTVARATGSAKGRAKSKGLSKVAVIRAYWTSPDAATQADVNQAFAEADAWYNEISLGQHRLQTAAGPTWVKIAPTDCNDLTLLTNRAIAAQKQAAPSFNPAAFDHIVVYFPHDTRCEYYSGLAELPGKRLLLNGVFSNGYDSLDIRTTTHEMGHNMGLAHSSSVACAAGATPLTIGGTCRAPIEYGDVTDNMGNNPYFYPNGRNVVPAFSASQQAKLGYLGRRLQLVTPCQTVALAPYEQSQGTVAVRVRGAGGLGYWLEYRHPAAGTYDSGLPATLRDGPLLHVTTPRSPKPDLLDGRPDAQGNMDDAAIPVGRSVGTPEGYTITTRSVGGAATVSIATSRPTPPLRVRARGVPGGAQVGWRPPACAGSSPVNRYRIELRSRGGKKWRQVATAKGNRTSSRISLPNRSRYVVRVTAINSRGTSISPTSSGVVRALAPRARLRVGGSPLITIGGTSRQTVTLLNAGRRPLANTKVTLQKRTPGSGWRKAASVRTNRRGVATLRTTPRTNTSYRWVFLGSATLSRTTSRVVRVKVAPRIALVQTKRAVKRGGTVTFAGRIVPPRAGQPVGIEAKAGKRWILLKAMRAVRKGSAVTYKFGVRFPKRGTFRLRVVTKATRTNVAGVSRVVVVRVR